MAALPAEMLDLNPCATLPALPDAAQPLFFANSTALWPRVETAARYGSLFFQEHGVPSVQAGAAMSRARSLGRALQLSPTDPEAKTVYHAGAGAIAPHGTLVAASRPATPEWADALRLGRAARHVGHLGGGLARTVLDTDGWVGGAEDPGAARRTATLLHATHLDAEAQRAALS